LGSNYSIEADAVLKMKAPNSKLRSGAALMLALWALFLLSAMVISWALDINSRLTVSGNASRVLDAEAMASSGADLALHPLVKPDSANLHRQIGNQEGYDVQIIGECGRLNLNLLAPGGVENTPLKEILRQYLSLKGVELNNADTMVDSLLDWMSPPGLHRLNACPESDDNKPPHAALTSVDDLKKVCGWTEFTSKPGWDEDFTISNCGGVLDLGWASRDMLRALVQSLGIGGDDKVDQFLQLRRGPDGIDGTSDDFQFAAAVGGAAQRGANAGSLPPEIQTALGLNQQQLQQNPSLAALNPGFKNTLVFRVTSVGKSGNVTRTVQMIVSKGGAAGGRPQVMSWKEL
jgi:Type II secretion system (T2SS), protein K